MRCAGAYALTSGCGHTGVPCERMCTDAHGFAGFAEPRTCLRAACGGVQTRGSGECARQGAATVARTQPHSEPFWRICSSWLARRPSGCVQKDLPSYPRRRKMKQRDGSALSAAKQKENLASNGAIWSLHPRSQALLYGLLRDNFGRNHSSIFQVDDLFAKQEQLGALMQAGAMLS